MKRSSVLLLLQAFLVTRVSSDDVFQCSICGEGNNVTDPLDVVSLPGQVDTTCAELEFFAESGGIDEPTCDIVQQYILEENACNCTGNTTLAPTPAPSPVHSEAPSFGPPPDCYTDLDNIRARENALTDEEVEVGRTYILCANTDFEMGVFNPENPVEYLLGFYPIQPRNNVHFQCGTEGLSSDNCVLKDGYFGVLLVHNDHEEDNNITFKGLTFESQQRTPVMAARAGDVTFIDCIFRDMQAYSILLSFFTGTGERRRAAENPSGPEAAHLEYMAEVADQLHMRDVLMPFEDEVEPEGGRELQAVKTLTLSFVWCVFENIKPLSSSIPLARNFMMGTSSSGTIISMENTIFRDIDYGDAEIQPSTTAINTFGPVKMVNTCFQNTHFARLAPIVTYGNPALELSNNYVDNPDSSLVCDFVANFDSPAGLETLVNYTCTDFDAKSCMEEDGGSVVAATWSALLLFSVTLFICEYM